MSDAVPETDRRGSPEIVEFSRRRRFLTWIWLFTTVVMLVGALVFANLLANRHSVQVDLTMDRLYSIQEATRKALAAVDRDVVVYTTPFTSSGPSAADPILPRALEQVHNLLDQFQRANPARIKIRTVRREGDEVLHEIRQHFGKESTANMVYIVSPREAAPAVKIAVPVAELYTGDRQTGALKTFAGESRIGSALLQAASDAKPVIYYTTGHKELVPGGEDGGISLVQRALENWQSAVLKPLEMSRAPAVPADCDVLLMAGVGTDLDPRELDMLQDYLQGGGRLFAALDIGEGKSLARFLEKWGLRANADIVLDPANPADVRWIRVRRFGEHEINAGMKGLYFDMPGSRSVEPIETGDPKRQAFALMHAGQHAWAQPVTRKEPRPEPDDPRGPPVAAGVSVTVDKPRDPQRPTAKIIVWGSPVALTKTTLMPRQEPRDEYLGYILNHFRWLMDQEGAISAPPLVIDRRPLDMTPTQREILFWIVVVAMPMIGVALGVTAWIFRRK